MTPFGEKLQKLRQAKKVSQKDMAAALGVSAAYLSALEHGQRAKPRWSMIQRIITYFNIIWDEAEELQYLASISDPKPCLDTTSLSSNATRLANLLAQNIRNFDEAKISSLIDMTEQKD